MVYKVKSAAEIDKIRDPRFGDRVFVENDGTEFVYGHYLLWEEIKKRKKRLDMKQNFL